MTLTHYGFFAGIGGFELAAEAAGFETVGMCEKDEYCRAILSQHFPGIPIKEDINDFTKEDAGGRPIYLVTAGVPNREARLRALGNCLVWKQVYPILAAIAEVERTYARS